MNRQDKSKNLPFHIGDKFILWEKVMKEVSLNRYSGPFKEVPFDNYVQSPIGLVPKDGGEHTRLIFHLSYNFKENKSVNSCTPKKYCTVQYQDLDCAVKQSLKLLEQILTGECDTIWYGKSDLKSAFRILGLSLEDYWLLVMMAVHPITGEKFYFVDKCLPFGHSISCSLFQAFSDALAHMANYLIAAKTGAERTVLMNYLDDFLFASLLKQLTNTMLEIFLAMCEDLGVPVLVEKTEKASNVIIFLGILIHGYLHELVVPEQKKIKALHLLNQMIDSRSVTVRDLQGLAELLNFLHQVIIPGRAFTRRMYAKFSHIIDGYGNKIMERKLNLTII